MTTTATATRTPTGLIEHYPIEFDGDLPIAGSVRIGYRVLRPENWHSHNPHFDSDIEWWIDAVNELYVPTVSGRARIDTASHHGDLVELIADTMHDQKVSRACAKHYDSAVL